MFQRELEQHITPLNVRLQGNGVIIKDAYEGRSMPHWRDELSKVVEQTNQTYRRLLTQQEQAEAHVERERAKANETLAEAAKDWNTEG